MFCETGKQLLQGFNADGFFAEYAVEAWQNLAKLPSTTDLSTAAPIFCAGITAFHSVDSCELKPGQWLAVIGCGGLGQLACQYGKAMGFKVLGIDINDKTLEVFKGQGADAVFNSRSNKSYVDELKKLTSGGVHAAAVFSDADAAYAGAPAIVRLNGLIMCGTYTPFALCYGTEIKLMIYSRSSQEPAVLGDGTGSVYWQVQVEGRID
jgi:propanol-preferring alcohol dehydrogenase